MFEPSYYNSDTSSKEKPHAFQEDEFEQGDEYEDEEEEFGSAEDAEEETAETEGGDADIEIDAKKPKGTMQRFPLPLDPLQTQAILLWPSPVSQVVQQIRENV